MDYGPITGSGAEKLADSAVAPLVAVAHGFQTIEPDTVKALGEELGLAPNSTQFKQLRSATGDRDSLLLRWFSPQDVVEQQRRDYPVPPSSSQIRAHPANVRTDERGKKRKYENLAGQQLVFGIHPATPADWLLEPIEHMLLAEGAMKADSALTAYLRKHGATDEELSVTADMDRMDAIEKMRPLLERIPANERVVIMSVVGVGTWHKNPEWNTLRLSGEVWVSFDGDVGTNPNVWTQANQMFEFLKHRGATPMLVDLSGRTTDTGEKMGVDDYLAEGHDWDDLMGNIHSELPQRPDGAQDGKYRMNPKTVRMEEKVVSRDDSGNEVVEWQPRVNLTARVVQIIQRREVSPEEEETGNYEHIVSPRDVESECVIEVEWMEDGERSLSRIEGPATMLATKPERWTDPRLEAGIGAEVLGLPSWPPTTNGFLEAMKSYRRDDVERTAAWTHMGWVPRVDGATPVFCVGTQVIGPSGFEPEAAICGVSESDLAGATNFGVDLPADDEQARNDIREMVRLYSACWSDPRSFSVMLAAALRPVVPIQTSVPLLLSGTTGSGKSYSSAAIMAFWQPAPNRWSNKHLPGSASDTLSATEIALSKTPIWVLDDNAPSTASPRAQAERTEAVNQTIRNVHNGAGKRRATKDMGSQKTMDPRALLVVSAESAPLDDQSIMNRLVHIEVQPGFLVKSREPTEAVERLNRETTTCARITGRALQMVAADIAKNGWVTVRKKWADEMAELADDTGEVVESANPDATSSVKRQSETIADMLLGAQLFRNLCDELGLGLEMAPLVNRMFSDLQSVAIEGFSENQRADLGNRFLADIRMLLSSQQAHVAALGVAGAPCVADGESMDNQTADATNQFLGWKLTGDIDRPVEARGEMIGFLVHTSQNRPVVLFTDAAFHLTQRKAQNRSGINQKAAWDAVWKAGLAVPEEEGWRRKPRSGDRKDYRVRVRNNGISREGVPVYLDTLMD